MLAKALVAKRERENARLSRDMIESLTEISSELGRFYIPGGLETIFVNWTCKNIFEGFRFAANVKQI